MSRNRNVFESASRFALAFLVAGAIAACAGGHSGAKPGIEVTNPGAKESDLVLLGETWKRGESGKIKVVMAKNWSVYKGGDLSLALHHGLVSTLANTIKPDLAQGLSVAGDGSAPETALRFRNLTDPKVAAEAAFSYIALHYPSRRDMDSTLYRGIDGNYFLHVGFATDSGREELYFDLDEWAAAVRTE